MSAAMEKAYRLLRESILTGQVAPGERLKERELCEAFEVSRTPVREALRRLEADGLVRLEPRRGGVVTQISETEAAEIFDLGAVLESYAARLAAQRRQPAGLAELDRLLEEMAAVIENADGDFRSRYMSLDHEFHNQVIRLSGSKRLATLVRQTVSAPVMVRSFTHYGPDDLRRSLAQHQTITTAIRAADPVWAEAAMRSHVLAARAHVLPDNAADHGESL